MVSTDPRSVCTISVAFAISMHCCLHLCIASSFSIPKTSHLDCNKAVHDSFFTRPSPPPPCAPLPPPAVVADTWLPVSSATSAISPCSIVPYNGNNIVPLLFTYYSHNCAILLLSPVLVWSLFRVSLIGAFCIKAHFGGHYYYCNSSVLFLGIFFCCSLSD